MAEPFDLKGKRVWVAGHRGMAGSAIVRRLSSEHCDILIAGRDEVDLRRQADVEAWIERARPDAVFVAAAKVGGIKANDSLPAEFLYDNLAIEVAVIHSAWKAGVKKLLFLGSTCVYAKLAPQPMPENALLSGPLEPTNEWYAVAKIAGIKLCETYRRQYGVDFILVMPTNLYGLNDNYHPDHSHAGGADPQDARGETQGRAVCDDLGHRHAAQARRHHEAEGARLAGEDGAARRARQGVREFQEKSRVGCPQAGNFMSVKKPSLYFGPINSRPTAL